MLQCFAYLNPVVCYWNIMTQPQCALCWSSCATVNATMHAMEWYAKYG